MSKISNMSLSDVFFQAPFAQKLVFGRGSAPDPAVELTTLPSPLVGWGGGDSSPITSPSTPKSILRSTPNKISSYAYAVRT